MMSRFVALLCLSAAACSHESRPAETAGTETTEDRAVSANATSTSTDPALTPASYEGKRADARESSTPPRAGELSPTPAPSPATGTSPSNAPATTAPAANSPTATTEPAYQPDNTKMNERDRSSAALTPMDQGNGEADLKLTQQIRQAVMADNKLSFTAKNIKIITKDGKVTLRGPVKTAEERAAIEADARRAAGTAPIDNQIEVKK
jgi:hypothetical protein